MEYIKDVYNKMHLKRGLGNPSGEAAAEVHEVIKDVIERTSPSTILELGFRHGATSSMFAFYAPKAEITSCDLVNNPNHNYNVSNILKLNPNFKFVKQNHMTILDDYYKKGRWIDKWDLIFIDGNHSDEAFRRDLNTAFTLGCKHILVDDYYHSGHRHIEQTIKTHKSDIISEYTQDCGYCLISTKNKPNDNLYREAPFKILDQPRLDRQL